MEIKHILVPVDFSESSKNALQSAIKIAKKAKAKITLVNAIHIHTPVPHLNGGTLIETFVSDYEDSVQKSFSELESEIVELNDVPHEADRFVTYLVDAIQTETSTKDIDLIVMGTRDKHTVSERLLGSNSRDIIKTADVPVIVIPQHSSEFNPQKIGFASDFMKVGGYKTLDFLNAITQLYEAELMVFHIADDIGAEEQKQINKIKDNLSSLENFSIRIVSGDSVVDGIKAFSSSHDLDLLTMMPREHNLFDRLFAQSVTKAVAIDLDIPLLTFRP